MRDGAATKGEEGEGTGGGDTSRTKGYFDGLNEN